MRHIKLKTKSGTEVILAPAPFSTGGEGAVYDIESPINHKQRNCAKLYTDCIQSPVIETVNLRENKINFLISNQPTKLEVADQYIIAWPLEALYHPKTGQFVGFIMKKGFSDSQFAFQLTNLSIDKNLTSDWHKRYQFNETKAINNRLKICFNIAKLMLLINESKKYVSVDFKPQNILITSNARVTLIDVDSLQITNNSQLLFPAKVTTSGYMPPEHQHYDFKTNPIPDTWERFQLALVFYELLLGIHPFTASGNPPYEEANNTQEKIDSGLFPFGPFKDRIKTYPKFQNNFRQLPGNIQDCFYNSFASGQIHISNRTTANDWAVAIRQALKTGVDIQYSVVKTPSILKKPDIPTDRPVPPPPKSKPKPPRPHVQVKHEFANWGMRLLAFLIDLIISVIVYAIVNSFSYEGYDKAYTVALIMFASLGTYYIGFEASSYQGTFGKRAMKMSVVDEDGNTLSIGRSCLRFWGKLISHSILGIGYLMPIWTEKKQALHDKIAGTVVIRKMK